VKTSAKSPQVSSLGKAPTRQKSQPPKQRKEGVLQRREKKGEKGHEAEVPRVGRGSLWRGRLPTPVTSARRPISLGGIRTSNPPFKEGVMKTTEEQIKTKWVYAGKEKEVYLWKN